jgi:flagellar motor switch protein FliM
MAEEVAQVLSSHFGRAFSHFLDDQKSPPPPPGEERISFRFIINVFGYSGEARLSMPRSELLHQMASGAAQGESVRDVEARQQLQRQVGKSDIELMVTLGPEKLSVEDIADLRPGRMIELSSTASGLVTIWSGGVAAFQGNLARSRDRLAVSITTVVT